MFGTEERGDASACLLEDRCRGAEAAVDAGRMRQQSDVSPRDQANGVRITVGNTVQACSDSRQSASPTAGASAVSPVRR
jgi:hypothetical protein